MLDHANKIPQIIRRHILAENLIGKAVNTQNTRTPMEYLFDVYEAYLDPAGEHDDWNCPQCRQYILMQWRKLLPYLQKLEYVQDTSS